MKKSSRKEAMVYPFGVKAGICRSITSKLKGMMFLSRNKAKPLLFIFEKERNIPIHMWFVFFPIDVLFLDDRMQVVEIKRGLRPWQSFTSRKAWRVAVEIPSLRPYKARLGDRLTF